jgi:hypothetical protein
MEYKSYKKIQEKIEVFEDASFVSLQDDKTALIKNSNGDTWSVPFSFEENELTLFGEEAELVELAPEIIEEEKEETVADVNRMILESAQDEDLFQDGLNKLVEVFINERKKYKLKSKKQDSTYESTSNIFESEEENEEKIWDSLNKDSRDFTIAFAESWEDKIKEVKGSFKELFESGFLFSNGTIKRKTILDPALILEAYKAKKENVNSFFEGLKNINDWYLKAEELGVMNESLNGVSLLSKDWKTHLLKNLVLQKRKGLEVNISEVLSELEKFGMEIISESDMTMNIGLNSSKIPGSHNGENQINFLKMGGVFTYTDLEKLISDFTRAMSTYQASGMERDTLGKISNYKDIADKMYRTNMIDDETVTNIITDFNATYGPVKDNMYAPLTTFKAGV